MKEESTCRCGCDCNVFDLNAEGLKPVLIDSEGKKTKYKTIIKEATKFV